MEWPLLASLPDEERKRVIGAARRRRYRRGEVIVHEGDPSDSLHLVAVGRLAVRVSTVDGEAMMLNVLAPGDYFGELSLLDQAPPRRTATVAALEPAETLSLSATEFRALRARHPQADQLLLTLLGRRVEELSQRLLQATYDGLDRRVHRRLLELVELYADGPDHPVVVPLTQEQLAELVGGTRPSVNQVLQKLASRGVVSIGRGRVTVVDRAWLAARAR